MQDLKAIRHLKFIAYWFLLGLLWLAVQLPWRARMALGAWIGRLMFALAKSRRHITEVNLRRVFPQRSEQDLQRALRQYAESVGQGMIETGMGWFWSEARLRKISQIEGDAAALAKVMDKQQPVVLVGLHTTLMELGVRLLGIYVDSAGMYRPLSNSFFHEWIKYQRGRSATELVHFKDMRAVLRILQSGGNLWYALDQDMGIRTGVFAPFFGIEACSVNILPKLSQRTAAAWIPVFIWREGREYVVRVGAEIPQYEEQSDTEVMTAVNAAYEMEIRQYPEQYFWLHRRFKTRPEGEKPWY